MVRLKPDLSSLNLFLRLPEFNPALEYIGGRVVQKMSPMLPHSVIQSELAIRLNSFARPLRLGRAFTELRGTFGGQSQVPDVSFFVAGRVPKFVRGQDAPQITVPPDLAVEILSPGQTLAELRAKIRHSLRHGSRIGWLIHPIREKVQVLRPGRKTQLLKSGDTLLGEEVLPGFALPLEEMFGWLDLD